MKSSDGFSRLAPSICVIVLFVVGAVLLTRAVQAQGLSAAYVLGLGIEVLVSIGLGRYLYDEHLTPSQIVGAMLILAGVATVRFG